MSRRKRKENKNSDFVNRNHRNDLTELGHEEEQLNDSVSNNDENAKEDKKTKEPEQTKHNPDQDKEKKNNAGFADFDFGAIAQEVVLSLIGAGQMKKEAEENAEKLELLIAKYNELHEEYKSTCKQLDKAQREASVYKKCFENILKSEWPEVKFSGYQAEWPVMEKILFILRRSHRKMSVREIRQILEVIDHMTIMKWNNPDHYIAQVLLKATEYERVIRIHEKGTSGNFYLLKKQNSIKYEPRHLE